MEDELNQLHNEKIKNELKAKEQFDLRVKETKEESNRREYKEGKGDRKCINPNIE